MISIQRTDSKNQNFIALVEQLDADLGERDGEEHAFYHQFNSIENLKYAIVLYTDKKPVGCGAIKAFDSTTMEVKRMYTLPEMRGKGLATTILKELEHWAFEIGYKTCILETGKRQPEAIALYTKNGYEFIPNYGQYEGIENSVCFQKDVSF
jgi:GNAT superfamily N-acetyltransferase